MSEYTTMTIGERIVTHTRRQLEILEMLKKSPMTRDQITIMLFGLSYNNVGQLKFRTTVFDDLKRLVKSGEVNDLGRLYKSFRGRPKVLYKLVSNDE